jgi:hypothetical protein
MPTTGKVAASASGPAKLSLLTPPQAEVHTPQRTAQDFFKLGHLATWHSRLEQR